MKENLLPEIKDRNGEIISKGTRVTFYHTHKDGKMKETTRKVLSTGYNVDHKNSLIHTLIKTNLGWRTAYDTWVAS